MITNFKIINATPHDLDVIYHLFEEAIAFQKRNGYIGWSNFDKAYIQADVESGLLFKMTTSNQIMSIFSVCYSDLFIWRDLEKADALYLHRIVLNQIFKGARVFEKVLTWAIELALKKGLTYIRIDTWADNAKIIGYYKSYGFQFLEEYITPDTENLPVQHRNLKVALLQLKIGQESF